MAVYIDDFEAPFQGMFMCHMVADTTDQLFEMVDRIGVNRKWIQYPGTTNEHFDICLSKKKKAVAAGAIQITARQYAEIVRNKDSAEQGDYVRAMNDAVCDTCGRLLSWHDMARGVPWLNKICDGSLVKL